MTNRHRIIWEISRFTMLPAKNGFSRPWSADSGRRTGWLSQLITLVETSSKLSWPVWEWGAEAKQANPANHVNQYLLCRCVTGYCVSFLIWKLSRIMNSLSNRTVVTIGDAIFGCLVQLFSNLKRRREKVMELWEKRVCILHSTLHGASFYAKKY